MAIGQLKTFQWSLPCVQIFWELPEDRQAEGLYGIKEIIERLYGGTAMDASDLPQSGTFFFNLTVPQSESCKLFDDAVIQRVRETGILYQADLESVMQDLKAKGILSAAQYVLFIGCQP